MSSSSTLDLTISQNYKDNFIMNQPNLFLYNIIKQNNITNLHIYKIESESEEVKILQTPQPLDDSTCITMLPNNKLFCYGSYPHSGITATIDENFRVRLLPPGVSCSYSSSIYFNNNVYCFGGWFFKALTLSRRFDLCKNRWIQLAPTPIPDFACSLIVYNGNILISGCYKQNILSYSIDIDAFSTIPYEFLKFRNKILINADRLYLIECYGWIYESEIENEYVWKQIANSRIDYDPYQICISYSKGVIYIGAINSSGFLDQAKYSIKYCKFDLNKKLINHL